MWKNNAEQGSPQLTIWHVRVLCWIFKATNTHPEYVLHFPFLLQQWLPERALMLRYMCFACHVKLLIFRSF